MKDKDGNVINFAEELLEEEEQQSEIKIEEKFEKEGKKKNRLEFQSVIQSLSNNMKKDISDICVSELKMAIKSDSAAEKLLQMKAKKKNKDQPVA